MCLYVCLFVYLTHTTHCIGRITLEKCKKAKEAREEASELADLDKSNIITQGNATVKIDIDFISEFALRGVLQKVKLSLFMNSADRAPTVRTKFMESSEILPISSPGK